MTYIKIIKNKKTNVHNINNPNLDICPYVRRLSTGRKCCAVMNCTRMARSRTELCIRHGGGLRCSIPGCKKAARDLGGICIKHGGGPRCLKQGCIRGAADKCAGHCVNHYNMLVALKRYRKEIEDDNSDESEFESVSLLNWKNSENKIGSQRSKKHRAISTSISSNNSVQSCSMISADSFRSFGEDVQNKIDITNENENENETENENNKSQMAISAFGSNMMNIVSLDGDNHVNYNNMHPITNSTDIQAVFHSTLPNSSSFPFHPASQLQPAIQQYEHKDIMISKPLMMISSQLQMSRACQIPIQSSYTPLPQNIQFITNMIPSNHPPNNYLNNIGFMNEIYAHSMQMSTNSQHITNNYAYQQALIPNGKMLFSPMRMKQF